MVPPLALRTTSSYRLRQSRIDQRPVIEVDVSNSTDRFRARSETRTGPIMRIRNTKPSLMVYHSISLMYIDQSPVSETYNSDMTISVWHKLGDGAHGPAIWLVSLLAVLWDLV